MKLVNVRQNDLRRPVRFGARIPVRVIGREIPAILTDNDGRGGLIAEHLRIQPRIGGDGVVAHRLVEREPFLDTGEVLDVEELFGLKPRRGWGRRAFQVDRPISQFVMAASQLAPWFSDVTFINWNLWGDPRIPKTISEADTLIVESVQRAVPERMSPPLIDVLRKAIAQR